MCDSAESLLRNVRVSQANVWGSGGEKLVYRRRAFSLDTFLRSASIFVTITPSDVGTLAISVISGCISVEEAEHLEGNEVPSHSQRVSIAGMDPLACTEYFEVVCDMFFSFMVRFDRKPDFLVREAVFLGFARDYWSCGGAQQRNSPYALHCTHSGLPRTAADLESCCKDPVTGEEFKDRFRKFVDSVVSTRIESAVFEMPPGEASCPKCEGSLS